MKNKNSDLRNLLFEGMERLLDPDDSFDAEKGIALAQMGKTIVDSAKAEIMTAKLIGAKELPTDFIPVHQVQDNSPKVVQLTPKQFDQITGT